MSTELGCYASSTQTAGHKQFPLNQHDCYSAESNAVVVRDNYCIVKSQSRLVSSHRLLFKELQLPFIAEAEAFQQRQCGLTTEDYHTIGTLDSNDNWKAPKIPTSGPDSMVVMLVRVQATGCATPHTWHRQCFCKTGGKSCTWASLTLLLASGRGNMKGKGKQMQKNWEIWQKDTSGWIRPAPRGPCLSHSILRHDTIA